MRLVLMIVCTMFLGFSAYPSKKNIFTEKFEHWLKQKKSYLNQQLEENLSQKQNLEQSIRKSEEKLALLNASKSFIQTKLPVIKEIQGYKRQLDELNGEINFQKKNINNIDLSDFSESADFKQWINGLEGLTTADIMDLEQEIAQLGAIQTSINSLNETLEAKNLSLDEFLNASNWEDLWMDSNGEEAAKIEEAMATITSMDGVIQNLDIQEILGAEKFNQLNTLVNTTLNLPIKTKRVAIIGKQNGFNLENAMANIEAEKAKSLQRVTKKHNMKEVNHKDYKEVVFSKKPELKDMMFLEADLTILKSNRALVNASSLLGMQMSNRFAVGLGTSYQNMDGLNQNLNGLWSGRLMTRMNVWKDILSVQLEGLSTLPGLSGSIDGGQNWGFSQLIGTRIKMPSSSKLPLNMTLLHNLNNKVASPAYSAPWQMQLGLRF